MTLSPFPLTHLSHRALQRVPIAWNHAIEKDSLLIKNLEHVLTGKPLRTFQGHALGAALALFLSATGAGAKEIHLDCARTDQKVALGLDTERRYLEIMWSEGVAEEYTQGESYISGPDSFGEKEKVTYVVTIDKDLVTFGQDRACLQSGTKKKCVDSQTRDTLDLARGELKYDLGDEVAVFKCQPAPPGRRF